MQFLAVLFDLDGTLLDTLEDIAASMNAALERAGFPPHPVPHYRQLVGGGVSDLSHRVLPAGSGAEDAHRVESFMREEYFRRWADRTRPYPGIRELLDTLRGAGVRRSVLSNKPEVFTLMLCERYFRPGDFEIVRGAREDVPKKPDPTAALAVARDMGIEPAQFAYLGDSGSDMKTALAACMFPVGALWGFRDKNEIAAAGARALIEKPVELMKVVIPL
jgi:phosphoglycolate phosphatase